MSIYKAPHKRSITTATRNKDIQTKPMVPNITCDSSFPSIGCTNKIVAKQSPWDTFKFDTKAPAQNQVSTQIVVAGIEVTANVDELDAPQEQSDSSDSNNNVDDMLSDAEYNSDINSDSDSY